MQVGDKVVCAFAGACSNVRTHGEYIVTALYEDDGHHLNIDVSTLEGKPCGTYWAKRFMLKSNVIEQVLENAKNG